ncbi:hypothetical protein T492DRAFT_911067 [Pavlovales sp. CCMP2436]|nr:hypothetical protein T492DRAFT_911067 [Pavlovales sp. CCMP2436]
MTQPRRWLHDASGEFSLPRDLWGAAGGDYVLNDLFTTGDFLSILFQFFYLEEPHYGERAARAGKPWAYALAAYALAAYALAAYALAAYALAAYALAAYALATYATRSRRMSASKTKLSGGSAVCLRLLQQALRRPTR